jgi:flagellar hook-associated protein 2
LEVFVGISTAGIGSGLDVDAIVTKLMQVEAQPLATFDKKSASVQAKLSAYGTLNGALSGFQSALTSLSKPATFQSVTSTSSNTDVLVGSASSTAVAGLYKINVSQIAQAQTLTSVGQANINSVIGSGTLSFQLGTVSGGSFGIAGGPLHALAASGGIANGALTINGTSIATSSATRSALLLAEAINAKSATTGVSATAAATTTSATLFGALGASTFGDIDTSGGGTYSLSVGGVALLSQGTGIAAGAGETAASLDAILAGSNNVTTALAAAGISVTGNAADGSLVFSQADGSNLAVTEAVTGSVAGGIGKTSADPNAGSSVTAYSSGITLESASASPIKIGGSDPARAGFTAGTGGAYLGASFEQDGGQLSGSVVIDSSNNTLQGIRDAINKAALGVTATIVSDGSATPNHLVLQSSKTGASTTIKLTVDGGDVALTNLLAYDPAGIQNLKQNTAAQSTLLDVNGISVTSNTNSVSGAIEGVSLTVGVVGSASLTVAKDSGGVKTGVESFVKAYNDLNKAIKELSGYDPTTKKGGALLGDSTAQNIQSQVRRQLTTSIPGLTGKLTTLSQIGISFQKDGTLNLDSGKLGKAITSNFADIGSLFAAIGTASDNLVTVAGSSAKTKPGNYALNITTLASQASLTSENALAPSTAIAANTTWSIKLNDTDPSSTTHYGTVTVPTGNYTPAQLATLLQSSINASANFVSDGVTVTVDGGGKLVVTSSRYGASANVGISSLTGTAYEDVFGATPVSADGVDVAGTLGGKDITGSGRFLTGAAGTDADGLKIEITGGALGDRGTVNFSQGYAHSLGALASSFLGTTGTITGRTNGLNATIKDIAKQKVTFTDRLVDIEKRYRAQYTALDTSISSLNSTSSFLTQQFAALAKQNN